MGFLKRRNNEDMGSKTEKETKYESKEIIDCSRKILVDQRL
jgi:hypothetical protein